MVRSAPVSSRARATVGAVARALRRRPDLAGWALAAPLAAAAAARLAGSERRTVLVMANAGTQWFYLPAYAALAVGVATRRPGLVAVSGGVVAAHLAWTLPELRPARPLPPGALDRPRLRVLSANLRFTAPDWSALAAEIAATDVDVVLLQELTPVNLAVLEKEGAFDRLPHSVVNAEPRSFGSGIWSALPLHDGGTWDVAGAPMTRATIHIGGRRLRIVNVHTRSPLKGGWAKWSAQLEALAALAAGASAEPGPLVMGGDFNATSGHRHFRSILRQGLRDAHVEAGRGWAVTWPRGFRLVPPVFRLDHVLVSEGVAVLSATEGTGKGSDHRPVIVDLAVL
jgi:endonuclease/exonuclease/phosphatase (EEP) superfamily protein YafD